MTDLPADPALALAVPLVWSFEGCVLTPYRDSGGVWTIGRGNTRLADGSHVTGDTPEITQAEADALSTLVIASTLVSVRHIVTIPLQPCEAAALTSFAYNVGVAAFGRSTLLRMLNSGNKIGAEDQFEAWVYADGVEVEGLLRRRTVEARVFAGGPMVA